MKQLLLIAFITTCFFSFGQTNMFWNHYSNINPAMSGLQHYQHGAFTIQNILPALSGNQNAAQANFNMRRAGRHGFGINYSGDYGSYLNNKLVANYNYQIDLKKAGKLSTGLGAGIGRTKYNEKYYNYYELSINPTPYTYFHLSFGAAYSWKNLILGVSTANLFSESIPALSSNPGTRIGINAHASYDFQVGQKFEITPRTLFSSYDGFHRLGFNVTTTYKKKFALGLSINSRNNLAMNAGWDINEAFRIAYSYDRIVSKLNNGAVGASHEFTIGYFLKHPKYKFRRLPDIPIEI